MGKRNVYTMSDGTEYYAVDVTYLVPKPLIDFIKKYDNVNFAKAIKYAFDVNFGTPADVYDADGAGRLFAVKDKETGTTRTHFVTGGMIDVPEDTLWEPDAEEFIDRYSDEVGNERVYTEIIYPRPKWR